MDRANNDVVVVNPRPGSLPLVRRRAPTLRSIAVASRRNLPRRSERRQGHPRPRRRPPCSNGPDLAVGGMELTLTTLSLRRSLVGRHVFRDDLEDGHLGRFQRTSPSVTLPPKAPRLERSQSTLGLTRDRASKFSNDADLDSPRPGRRAKRAAETRPGRQNARSDPVFVRHLISTLGGEGGAGAGHVCGGAGATKRIGGKGATACTAAAQGRCRGAPAATCSGPAELPRPLGALSGRGSHTIARWSRAAERANASKVRFDERGLAPCVMQDSRSGEVLTLAYMNGRPCASPSRPARSISTAAVAGDLAQGRHLGQHPAAPPAPIRLRRRCPRRAGRACRPACHTGERSCFYRDLEGTADPAEDAPPVPASRSPVPMKRSLCSSALWSPASRAAPRRAATRSSCSTIRLAGSKVKEEAGEVQGGQTRVRGAGRRGGRRRHLPPRGAAALARRLDGRGAADPQWPSRDEPVSRSRRLARTRADLDRARELARGGQRPRSATVRRRHRDPGLAPS